MTETKPEIVETPQAELIAKFFAKRVKKSSKRGVVNEVELAERVGEIELETQILGASFITVTIIDPEWALQTSGFVDVVEGLLDEIEVEFPENSGWFWVLCKVEGSTEVSTANFTMVFEDKVIAELRQYWGPKQAPAGTQTRAQFVRDLVNEVGQHGEPKLEFHCPSLNIVQPVEEETKGELGTALVSTAIQKKTSEAKANKSAGAGAGAAITIKGAKPTATQLDLVNEVMSIANHFSSGNLAAEALIEACITENDFTNNGVGLLQFEPATASGLGIQPLNVKDQVTAFLTKSYSRGTLETGPGGAIEYAQKHPNAPAYEVAQAAQGSGAGASTKGQANYGKSAAEAKKIVEATGGVKLGGTTGTAESDVGQLTRGTAGNPDEDSSEAINRLATQVNWFAFSDSKSFFYMDGPDLAKQKPSLYLDVVKNHTIDGHTGQNEYGTILSPTTYTFDNCLALDTLIPTPTGWTTMGELQTGQMVLGSDGRPVAVERASEVYAGRECYEVTFSDGTTIVTDAGHLWETRTVRTSNNRAIDGNRRLGIYTTEEIAQSIYAYDKPPNPARHNHRIKVTDPLDLPDVDLPVDPYILGYWLGDGSHKGACLTVGNEDLANILAQIEACGYSHKATQYRSTGFSKKLYWHVSVSIQPVWKQSTRWDDTLPKRLKQVGVWGNKNIPDQYLRASIDQRIALLQGLMDADGTFAKHACISLADFKLAQGALELIRSLGFCAYSRIKPARNKDKPQQAIIFSSRTHVNPFRLQRKAEKYDLATNRSGKSRCAHRTITSVERASSVPVKCIAVNTNDHLYLAGESMVPTHNTTFEYRQTHKVKAKVQRRSKIAKPSTPSEIRLKMVCPIDLYRAGDVFVFQNSGPIDGRWIVTDATRNCLKDTFTQFILEPPVEPLPEPKATEKGEELVGGTAASASSIAGAAKKALSEKSQYVYSEASNRENKGTLYGPAPRTMDCSAFATLCYKAAGAPDPSGMNYSPIGNTDSMIKKMKKVTNPKPGACCFFGSSVSATTHVTVYVGGGQAISMGKQGDPEEGPAETTGPAGFLGYYEL